MGLTGREASDIYKKRRELEQKNSKKFVPGDYHTPKDRMAALQAFAAGAELREPIDSKTLVKRRRSFDSVKNRLFPILALPCWVCGHDAAHRHHVVPLKYGGSPTSKKNVVLLCEVCHVEIHPWMMAVKPLRPLSAAEFEVARQKNEVGVILDQLARGKMDIETADVKISGITRRVFNTLCPESLT